MSAPPILIVLFCLIASACAGLDANESALPRTVPPPPEGKKLAELVNAAATVAKLPGAPEVSPVHSTHDTQRGDWIFCIKSNKPDESSKYAVLIGNNTILEVRSFVLIDGCEKEAYHPIEATDQHGDLAGSHSGSPRQSQQHR